MLEQMGVDHEVVGGEIVVGAKQVDNLDAIAEGLIAAGWVKDRGTIVKPWKREGISALPIGYKNGMLFTPDSHIDMTSLGRNKKYKELFPATYDAFKTNTIAKNTKKIVSEFNKFAALIEAAKIKLS